jgi:hypothetical protein
MPRAAILHPSGTRNLATIHEMFAELNRIVDGTERDVLDVRDTR